MQARARAWALGDVDDAARSCRTPTTAPPASPRSRPPSACASSSRAPQDDWLIAVEDSLARNRGTLAVQSMDRLLGEHGALATLRAKGYQVEGP